MPYTLQHPSRGTVTVQTATRRDALMGRGFTEVKAEKPAPKKTTTRKAAEPKREDADTDND